MGRGKRQSVCSLFLSRRAAMLLLRRFLSLSLIFGTNKTTHNVRQQGPEEAHEDDLDDGEEGLEESRNEGEGEAIGEYSLFVSHLGKKQLGQRSSNHLVSFASFRAVASCCRKRAKFTCRMVPVLHIWRGMAIEDGARKGDRDRERRQGE